MVNALLLVFLTICRSFKSKKKHPKYNNNMNKKGVLRIKENIYLTVTICYFIGVRTILMLQ